ncbi:methyltransferase [Clostridium sp. BL-8]|uniref:methyltransferase n=1 Tax=Clostridium sp. BL-8 TaxID=349938 RepID=UPI0009D1BBED|nr:methyltransferase [Clostridium sp. BL-8]OOM77114.1 50S ribosomal protein L3 glutamine methyltransferase [Clostridium sp. BL-8]
MQYKLMIKKFINELDKSGYKQILRLIRGNEFFINPWGNFNLIKNKLLLGNFEIKELILFFYLGIPIEERYINKFLSKPIKDLLFSYGIIQKCDTMLRAAKALIPYNDIYVFADFPYFYPTCLDKTSPIYIGIDSFLLSSLLPCKKYQNILDLCTGSGIHSILLSKSNAKVTGIDITEEALETAKLNAIINDCESSATFIKSDIFSNVSEKYDLIIANPPTQVIPENVQYPLIGDGGEDGLKIIRKIINNLDNYLDDNGVFYSIVQLLGDNNEPKYLNELKTISKNKNWRTKTIIHERMPLTLQAKTMSGCSSKIYNKTYNEAEWVEYYNKQNLTYLYNVIIKIEKRQGFEFIIDSINFINGNDVLLKIANLDIATLKGYHINNIDYNITEIQKFFLDKCDGSYTINEIEDIIEKNFKLTIEDKFQLEKLYRNLYSFGVLSKV